MKKLELYGTLGPADCEKSILREMFQAGMTGIRLNLSHSNLADCEAWLHNLFEVSDEMRIAPDLLVDLQGPELRIGLLSGPMVLTKGQTIHLTSTHFEDERAIPVPPQVLPYLETGQTLRLDDGKILLKVLDTKKNISAEVLTDGILFSRKSLSIDGVSVDLPTLTPQDEINLQMFRRYRVTGVMLPFVRNKEDLLHLREALLRENLADIRIFAKIENQKGIEHLHSLFPYCDHIVIARGDLGNAVPLPELPATQKRIARMCLLAKKPFMVVTQLLNSMEQKPVPTRAEVSDIFNAVLDGASSLMLTGETALGKYPAKAMQVLSDTSFEALRYKIKEQFML